MQCWDPEVRALETGNSTWWYALLSRQVFEYLDVFAKSQPDRSTWSDTVRKLEGCGDVEVIPFDLRLDYDQWTARREKSCLHPNHCFVLTPCADDILAATLPEQFQDDLPTGFNHVGHVGKFAPYLSRQQN